METNITKWNNAEDINAVTLPVYEQVWLVRKDQGKKKKKWTDQELEYMDFAEDPNEINDLPNVPPGSCFTREELLEMWKKKRLAALPQEDDDLLEEEVLSEQNIIENLDSYIQQADQKLDPELLPNKLDTKITQSQVGQIVFDLSKRLSVPSASVFTLIYFLFLKGAANKGAPDSLKTSIIYNGDKVDLTKKQLMYSYKFFTNNQHLRRLAEYLATPDIGICPKKQCSGGMLL